MDTNGSTELAPSLNITAEISGIPHAPDRFTDYADIYCGWRAGPHGEEQVTLRFPRITTPGQAEHLEPLRREVSIWSTVKHDNILPFYGVYSPATGPPALVYPWCSFGTVKEFLRLQLANPSLLGLKLLILDEIFQAVNYLHQHAPKIIHGHLKGDNVMISSNRRALLCDFSFAEMLDTGSRGTAPSASSAIVTGSYRWMAPELLEERSQRSLATDIWACGCLILEILSLSLPYEDQAGEAQVIRALSRKQLPSRPSGIPDELWELAATCWHVDPARRPHITTVLNTIHEARAAYPSTNPDNDSRAVLMPDGANFDHYRALFVGEDITTRVSNVSLHVSAGGGYSDIYKADLATDFGSVKVAVKVIRAEHSLKNLKKEIAVWCELHHSNILRLYGLSWNHGQRKLPGMVSPWCSNGDVLYYLRKYQGDTQLGSIKHKMLRDIIHGLDFLHAHKPAIVHGDLKATNVLVSDDGNACICDFGLSAMTPEQFPQTPAPSGTARWMAPELHSKEYARHTMESDVWAYGCVILEVEAGLTPYKGHTDASLIVQIINEQPPAAEGIMPEGTWKIANDCWQFDPEKRPTARALVLAVAHARD